MSDLPADPAAVDWSALAAPRAGLHGVVVLPARNEAALLPAALGALTEQAAAQTAVSGRRFEILVLANNCRDATAALARRAGEASPHCPVHVVEAELTGSRANVGTARRELMEQAAARLQVVGATEGVILSTDADTCVADGWLEAALAAIDAGADAVGGRLLTHTESDAAPGIVHLQRLDTVYWLQRARLESLIDPDAADPWPRHHQHFGASLAITLAAYRRVGGLPRVPCLEDLALVTALQREDCRIRHSTRMRAWTSGRLDGRAEVGLSWQLRRWTHDLGEHLMPAVPDPAHDATVWQARRAARQVWSMRDQRRFQELPLRGLARLLGSEAHGVAAGARGEPTFGRFWAAFEHLPAARLGKPNDGSGVPLDEAVRWLRGALRSGAAASGSTELAGKLGTTSR